MHRDVLKHDTSVEGRLYDLGALAVHGCDTPVGVSVSVNAGGFFAHLQAAAVAFGKGGSLLAVATCGVVGDEDREPRRGLLKRTLGRVRERSSSARTLYTGATLAIEFWFQFEVYAFLPAVSLLPRVALFLLLSSHYVWFVVGVAGLFVNVGPKPKPNARPAGHWGFPSDFMSRRWASRKRVADNAAASDDLRAVASRAARAAVAAANPTRVDDLAAVGHAVAPGARGSVAKTDATCVA